MMIFVVDKKTEELYKTNVELEMLLGLDDDKDRDFKMFQDKAKAKGYIFEKIVKPTYVL